MVKLIEKPKLCNSYTILLEFSVWSVKVINSLEIVLPLKFAGLTYLPVAANIVQQLLSKVLPTVFRGN